MCVGVFDTCGGLGDYVCVFIGEKNIN